MTTQYPDMIYVQVTNTSPQPQTFYLSDLDTEARRKPNQSFPVYIGWGETVLLPLTTEVVNSFQQGGLRGLVDKGFITVSVTGYPEGSGGSGVTPEQEEKIATLTYGQIVTKLPMDVGFRDSSNVVSTNRYGGLLFQTSGVNDGDGWWRFPAEIPQTWASGDMIVRLYITLANTGGVGEQVEFRLGLRFHDVGESLGNPVPNYDYYSQILDVENLAFRTIETIDFVIPAAQFDKSKDLLFMEVARNIFAGNDNYPASVYLHDIAFVYNGWGFDPNAQPPQ